MRAKEQAGTATSGKCDRHGGASSHVYQHASGLCIHSTSGGGESRVSTAHFISLYLALMDDLQLRRLRKKLRQIETLEHLQRELNPSETSKVSQKAELRCLVAELLSRDAQANRGDESAETKGRESRVPPILHPNPSVTPRPQATDSAPEAKLKVPGPHTLGHSQFRVRCLEGHNDLVTCVLIHDPFIISGSWDTSLRVWDVSSGSELKTLCGHTEGVTCLTHISDVGAVALGSSLLLPPDEVFVSSGSSDSSIKVWSLRTGLPVLSLYTFSAVSSLTHIPNTQLLVSGSDGGKVEVWDLLTRENRQSERAHEESVTALQVHSGLLFSGSEGGCLKVWRVSSSGSLSLLYSSDALMLSLCGLRSLCVMGNRVYIATQGVSVKVLDWKQGSLARLSNHTSDSGFVDALAVTPDGLLVTSGFNIDQGHGYLNIRSGDTGCYLKTLSSPDAPRILSLAVSRTPGGLCRWVTGGKELLLWEELPKGEKLEDGVALRFQFCAEFLRPAPETESEEESEEETDRQGQDTETVSSTQLVEARGWLWCALL